MAEMRGEIQATLALLSPYDRNDAIFRTMLLTLWKLAENAALLTHHQAALEEQFHTLLETLMPADTKAMNQNYADAKSNVVQLAAAHGTSSTEAQSIADDAATKFADLRDTAKAGLPVDTTVGSGGADTTGGGAGAI